MKPLQLLFMTKREIKRVKQAERGGTNFKYTPHPDVQKIIDDICQVIEKTRPVMFVVDSLAPGLR